MRINLIKGGLLIILFVLSYKSYGQYTFFSPKDAFAIEASLANTELIRLPMYRNAITSLESIGEYIIGGTSANDELSPFIFVATLHEKKMVSTFDLSQILPNQKAIQSGFVKDRGNGLFAGTMAQESNQDGGHLIKIMVDSEGNINVKDLGIPVRSEGIFSLTGSKKGDKLYGVTFPNGYFFEYDVESGLAKTYNEVVPDQRLTRSLQSDFALTPEDYLSGALIVGQNDLVYGSLPYGEIFTYNPHNKEFNRLIDSIPSIWGREALAQVDSWCLTSDGKLYGGNRADGQLFEVNTKTGEVQNLGKPIMMGGMPGLAAGKNGKIYGLAGGTPGYSHLFTYEPGKGFKDLGNPQFTMIAPGIDQGIAWRGFQLSSITISENGQYVIMGENEALSQLMVFPIED